MQTKSTWCRRALSFILAAVMAFAVLTSVPLTSDAANTAYTPPPEARNTPADAQVITTANSYSNTTNTRHWGVVWSDEFSGNTLDTTKWDYQYGNGWEYGLWGWGNQEVQYYRPENVTVRNNQLVITARNESFVGIFNDRATYNYTSGKLRTIGSSRDRHTTQGSQIPSGNNNTLFSTKYGRIEARIKLPAGEGLWPAFWMMPAYDVYGAWPRSGEIDIMEARGRLTNEVTSAIHYGGAYPLHEYKHATHRPTGFSTTDFNTYAVEWLEGEIIFFVNDIPYHRRRANEWWTRAGDISSPLQGSPNAPFDEEFYIILNLAVGGHFDGGRPVLPNTWDTPAEMVVDYVRVYHPLEELPPHTGFANITGYTRVMFTLLILSAGAWGYVFLRKRRKGRES